MRGARRKVTKILITIALTLSMFGCATSVFAAGRDLVGGGTSRTVVRNSSSSASAGNVTSSAAAGSGAGASASTGTQAASGTAGSQTVSGNTAAAEQQNVRTAGGSGQSTAPAVTVAAGNAATGYIDIITPFMVLFVWTFLLFWALTITLIHRVRERRNAVYHEEYLEFRRTMSQDIDLGSIITI